VNIEYIFLALAYGVGLFFLDESRKFIVRKYRNGVLANIAW
jgi:sodium/potassium-transporting ATPase subunit alpha